MGDLGWAEIASFVIVGGIALWAAVFGLVWYMSRRMRWGAEQDTPDEASPAGDEGRPSNTSEDDRPA